MQDNNYAISVPIADQTSGSSVYNISSGYENLARFNVDGTNFFETYAEKNLSSLNVAAIQQRKHLYLMF